MLSELSSGSRREHPSGEAPFHRKPKDTGDLFKVRVTCESHEGGGAQTPAWRLPVTRLLTVISWASGPWSEAERPPLTHPAPLLCRMSQVGVCTPLPIPGRCPHCSPAPPDRSTSTRVQLQGWLFWKLPAPSDRKRQPSPGVGVDPAPPPGPGLEAAPAPHLCVSRPWRAGVGWGSPVRLWSGGLGATLAGGASGSPASPRTSATDWTSRCLPVKRRVSHRLIPS